jgi:Phospholipid methyltransferase
LLISKYVSFPIALLYFFALFIVRYVYLFGGFVKNGFSGWLIQKYGEEKAWGIYEFFTAVMFFQRGLSFGLLVEATQWSIFDWGGGYLLQLGIVDIQSFKYVCFSLGLLLVLIGFLVNITATLVIGIDTYYYKDLFLKRSVVDFKEEGPYKYFSNPMYGIGQSSGYGAALMVGSITGILVTLLNQVVMYVFYYLIEKPHIQAMLKKFNAAKFSILTNDLTSQNANVI